VFDKIYTNMMFCINYCRDGDGGEHISQVHPSCIHLRKKQSPAEKRVDQCWLFGVLVRRGTNIDTSSDLKSETREMGR
jgi:hypothetical protein